MNLLDLLLCLKGAPPPKYSICQALRPHVEVKHTLWLIGKFKSWDKGTNRADFPVPANRYDKSVYSAGCTFKTCRDYWDKSTQYGRLRHELLDYLIEQAKLEGV